MWAQGLTIGLLIVAGALTHSKRKEFAQEVRYLGCGKSSWLIDFCSNNTIILGQISWVVFWTFTPNIVDNESSLQIEQQEHDRKDAEALKMSAGSHDNRRALSAHVDRTWSRYTLPHLNIVHWIKFSAMCSWT